MVEYGNGVGTATNVANGGSGGGGGSMDVGAVASNFVHDAAHTISTLPPEGWVILVVAVFLGLVFLRKAF
jgi:hypothetical protein